MESGVYGEIVIVIIRKKVTIKQVGSARKSAGMMSLAMM